jgi:hypothetical protein
VPRAIPRSAWTSAAASFTPIADHGDRAPLALEASHLLDLVLGQHLREHSIDAQRVGHRARRPLVVARQEDHREPAPGKVGHDGPCLVLRRVGHGKKSRHLAIPPSEDCGPAFLLERAGAPLDLVR